MRTPLARRARVGLAIVAGVFSLAVLGPLVVGDPAAFVGRPHQPPSLAHWLGTTGQGQDVLAQTVCGARTTLAVGFAVGFAITAIALAVALLAAYRGGRVDALLSLAINVFLLLPGLPLAVVVAAYLPPGPLTIATVLIATGWGWNARVLRAQAVQLRRAEYVEAAIVGGERGLRVALVEMAPNLLPLIVTCFVGATAYAIGAQVGLEFLGLGDPGAITWGTNLFWAANDAALLTGSWWLFLPTGVGIALVGFGLALIATGIDDRVDPRLRAAAAAPVSPATVVTRRRG